MLRLFRPAATQYQTAASNLSSMELFLKASDCWESCTKSPSTSRALLFCLNAAGSPAYPRLLFTLESEWISRDDDYTRIFENFAYKYGEEASDQHTTRIAKLFGTFDEGVSFLEDLDRKSLVEELLKTNQSWERLALIYEERLELDKAMEFWELACRADVVGKWKAAQDSLKYWKVLHTTPRDTRLLDSDVDSLNERPDVEGHPYFELCEYLRILQGQHHLLHESKRELNTDAVRRLLCVILEWQSKAAGWMEYGSQLSTGSLPEKGPVEALGIYRAQFGSDIFLISQSQRKRWKDCNTAPSAEGSSRRVPTTTAQLAHLLGKFCKAVTREAERKAFAILAYLANFCESLSETAAHFDLQADTAVSSIRC
jgi:hypothetical protein